MKVDPIFSPKTKYYSYKVKGQFLPQNAIGPTGGGGGLRKYVYGDAQSRLQNVDHLYTCVLKKNKPKTHTHTHDHYNSLV